MERLWYHPFLSLSRTFKYLILKVVSTSYRVLTDSQALSEPGSFHRVLVWTLQRRKAS